MVRIWDSGEWKENYYCPHLIEIVDQSGALHGESFLELPPLDKFTKQVELLSLKKILTITSRTVTETSDLSLMMN